MLKFNVSRLKAERVANNITQADMAKGMGYESTSTYTKKENGNLRIGVDEFAQMISLLGYNKDQISIFFTLEVPEREPEEKLRV